MGNEQEKPAGTETLSTSRLGGPTVRVPARGKGAPDSRESGEDWLGDREALVRLAHRFVWSPDDAEDIVHDAILHAERSRDQLRNASRAGAWLQRIVVRKALLHIRQAKRQRRGVESAARMVPEQSWGPQDLAADREQAMMLRKAIEQLPPQQQVAVTLRHLEEMSYRQIAEIMEITESTVRFHVREARVALASTLRADQ